MEKTTLRKQRRLRVYQTKDIKKFKEREKKYIEQIDVRINKIREVDGLKIFLVDGKKIRDFIDIDFTMGGHGYRYLYIPLDEIWIDSSNESEKEEVILHELTEFRLMRAGMNYDHAHDTSSIEEMKLRTKKIILSLGHYRQINPESCGPSALKIVLDYYNDKRSIKQLIKETGCDKTGTLHEGFKNFLRKAGYEFFEKENAAIKDIEYFLRQAIPVIVDFQAYHGTHFSVIIGQDEKKFLFSDPAFNKKYKWITKEDFEKRWFGEDDPGIIDNKWLLAIPAKHKKVVNQNIY